METRTEETTESSLTRDLGSLTLLEVMDGKSFLMRGLLNFLKPGEVLLVEPSDKPDQVIVKAGPSLF